MFLDICFAFVLCCLPIWVRNFSFYFLFSMSLSLVDRWVGVCVCVSERIGGSGGERVSHITSSTPFASPHPLTYIYGRLSIIHHGNLVRCCWFKNIVSDIGQTYLFVGNLVFGPTKPVPLIHLTDV